MRDIKVSLPLRKYMMLLKIPYHIELKNQHVLKQRKKTNVSKKRKRMKAAIYDELDNNKCRSSLPEVLCKRRTPVFFFSFLVKSLRPATLLKKSLWHRYFQNFQNFLVHIFYRTPLDDCFLNFKILMNLWTYEFQMRKTAYIELSFLPIALKYCHVSCFHCYCYSIVENRKSSPLVDDQVELPSS